VDSSSGSDGDCFLNFRLGVHMSATDIRAEWRTLWDAEPEELRLIIAGNLGYQEAAPSDGWASDHGRWLKVVSGLEAHPGGLTLGCFPKPNLSDGWGWKAWSTARSVSDAIATGEGPSAVAVMRGADLFVRLLADA
jgi:hypothetical protein